MSAPTVDGPRIYRGLNVRERAGWVLGLTPLQAVAVLGLGAPVLLSMSSGRWSEALLLLVTNGVGVALVVVPVRGRSALRWLADLLTFQLGVAMRWSMWQSRAAAGAPGTAARARPARGADPAALPRRPPAAGPGSGLPDPRHRRGSVGGHRAADPLRASACCPTRSASGSPPGWARCSIALGHREVVDRMSLLVRTVPDDGAEYERVAGRPRTPASARRSPAPPPTSWTTPSARSACAPSCS